MASRHQCRWTASYPWLEVVAISELNLCTSSKSAAGSRYKSDEQTNCEDGVPNRILCCFLVDAIWAKEGQRRVQ